MDTPHPSDALAAGAIHLALGTLRLAHVEGLQLSRRFSLTRPSGPEPGGTLAAFRAVLLASTHDPALRPAATPRRGNKPLPE